MRFVYFFKVLMVEFDCLKFGVYGNEIIVEWKKLDKMFLGVQNFFVIVDFDEFVFKRFGDENFNIIINLFRYEEFEWFVVSLELVDIIDEIDVIFKEVILVVYEYIKFFGLQDDEEICNF